MTEQKLIWPSHDQQPVDRNVLPYHGEWAADGLITKHMFASLCPRQIMKHVMKVIRRSVNHKKN